MSLNSRLKTKEFDPILVDWKVQSTLDFADCALEQGNFKLVLNKLNETRSRLDQCENGELKAIHWNELYCHVHLKRHQNSSLENLFSSLVGKELKKLENKINSFADRNDRQISSFVSRSTKLNSMFARKILNVLLENPDAYRSFERNEQISPGKHQQMEFYLDYPKKNLQDAETLIAELFHRTSQNFHQENGSTAENFNGLASFCDEFLRRYENQDDDFHLLNSLFAHGQAEKIAELVVQSIISSMKLGSDQGVKRFSRILKIFELYPSTVKTIDQHLQEIPSWMFFDCLYQITAYLDKPIG